MEFLFLNEDTTQESSVDQMKAFAESVGVNIEEDAGKTLNEVMLECTEELHEAEMTAMQEEFALFQESTTAEDQEVFQESAMKKIGDTLKRWWEAIKKFCVKMWAKIVHWFWATVQWCRKAMQTAINKVHGSQFVYVNSELPSIVGAATKKVADIKSKIEEEAGKLIKAAEKREAAAAMKDKEINKMHNDFVKAIANEKENSKKRILKNKKQEKIPLSTWKKWMDETLKNYEATKAAADKANTAAQKKIKETDKELEEFYKGDGKDENKKRDILARGKANSLSAKAIAKMAGAATSYTRWLMGALYSGASYKASKEEKETKLD